MISRSIVEPFMENHRLKEIKIQGTQPAREYYFVHHKSKFLTRKHERFSGIYDSTVGAVIGKMYKNK